MKIISFILVYFCLTFAIGQDHPKVSIPNSESRYDTDLLSADFHKARRNALRELMPDSSVAVFFANPVRNRSNDVDYEYHQDPNFYYLTGLQEPHAVLLVFKEAQELDSIHTNEIIFVQPRDSLTELWNGKRLGTDGVALKLGLDYAYPNSDFALFEFDQNTLKTISYVDPGTDLRDDPLRKGDLSSLRKHFLKHKDSSGISFDALSASKWMAELRQQKTPEELKLMRKAILITCLAQEELMKAVIPGMKEYETEAVVEFVFKKNGAEYPGFPSIMGSGENSCVLHYVTNRKVLGWDDLLVSDVGAEYHGYTADVTRTIPVDGEFSPEQRAIYDLVKKAQEAGIKACRSGNKFWDPHQEARKVLASGLVELGIIEDYRGLGQYFMHGTSHYLGLDVHDAGTYQTLKPGQVITVEPGVYIKEGSPCDPKWWNIGVRIEDDVLITDGDPDVLSDCVTKEVQEIESMMKLDSPLNQQNMDLPDKHNHEH